MAPTLPCRVIRSLSTMNRHTSTASPAARTISCEHSSSTAIVTSAMASRSKSSRMAIVLATARNTGSWVASAGTRTSTAWGTSTSKP
ncbi:hypothetical protein [Fodinicola feengrottensis]|uniref:hypothetical protein n=1 Tax=Fodinicola feengrottensis TaxID=435914 RepID=UPI0013D38B56|nr:hypothetical protein [Fodinicola feengrottensis]